jgi:hypothetical protein
MANVLFAMRTPRWRGSARTFARPAREALSADAAPRRGGGCTVRRTEARLGRMADDATRAGP